MQIRGMLTQNHDCEVSNIDHTVSTSFADQPFSDLGSEHDDSSDRSNSSSSQESDNINDSPDSIVLSTSGSSNTHALSTLVQAWYLWMMTMVD